MVRPAEPPTPSPDESLRRRTLCAVQAVTLKMLRDSIAEALWEAMNAAEVERFCSAIGLAGPADEAYSSKRGYVARRLVGVAKPQLVEIGVRVLDECDSGAEAARALAGLIAGFARGGVAGEMKNLN